MSKNLYLRWVADGRRQQCWRKVRAPQGRMLDNIQARKRDRQCNRKQTAPHGFRPVEVRVKWRGKSSPRSWRQGWHGKPHPVQDQAGFRSQQCGPGAARASWFPGRSLEAVGNDSSREMVIAPQGEQNPAYNYSTRRPPPKAGAFTFSLATCHNFEQNKKPLRSRRGSL